MAQLADNSGWRAQADHPLLPVVLKKKPGERGVAWHGRLGINPVLRPALSLEFGVKYVQLGMQRI
jgi:hypothetical protein